MKKIVECVPNFSEGKDQNKIKQIVDAGRIGDVIILDIESDPDHNRMLTTIVGEPEAVFHSVWQMIVRAVELIDMRIHKGEHPRIGAVDVVPFIPVANISMAECIALAKRLGQKVADELKIPIFLYEAAATRVDRVNLADVRRGEYEGLKIEIETNPTKFPDFGPAKFHITAGAMIIGARKFLIAFNVNLDTKDVQIAKDIAKLVREKDGGFPTVKALGFEIKDKNCVQISMNLCDFEKTNMEVVFRKIKEEASKRGIKILGSEIYGMIPQAALKGIVLSELQLIDFKESQILENRISNV